MRQTIIYIMLCIISIYAYRSQPSDAVGVAKFDNITTGRSDLNYISLPFDAGYTLSSQIDPSGTRINSISRWNAINQSWRTSTFIPFNTVPWVNVYSITEGDAFCVNAMNDHSLYFAGEYAVIPPYQLITTEGTSLNLIMHPIEKYNLTYAGNGVGNDIGVCNSVSKWNANTQTNMTTTYIPNYGWANDFSSKPGQPLFVNMTDSLLWPYEETKKESNKNKGDYVGEVNLPKVVYYHIINSEGIDYEIFSKSISFKAWIKGREDDMLTESSYNCGFMHLADSLSSIYFNLGNFKNKWLPDEIVNIVVTEVKANKNSNVTLEGTASYEIEDNADAAIKGYDQFVKGSGEPIVVGTPTDSESSIPYETVLYQNYPNPFNPVTAIKFSLKSDCKVKLYVYNYKGQVVKEIINDNLKRGYHKADFDATALSSGLYFYALEADGMKFIKKMVLVR